jgi:hypothetical protein
VLPEMRRFRRNISAVIVRLQLQLVDAYCYQ